MFKFIFDLIVGSIIGSVAGELMDNKKMGFLKNAFLGILGGLVAGVASNILHVNSLAAQFVLSVAGACLIIFAARKLLK